MLSYVEFYRPKFFLLENVLGLLLHKLQVNKAGPQEGNVVAHGIVKFILRTLTSLGYVPLSNISYHSPPKKSTHPLENSLKRAIVNHARTAIKCASASCKPGSTDRRSIVAASSSGVHGGAFLSPSSRFRRIISGRRYGPYSSTRVSNSTMSRATRTGLIVARLYAPSPWMMSFPTW
jgi:hypothetical protein